MEFNNRFYTLRKQSGLSQEELANRLNVTRQTVSKWEVGDSTPDMEKLIAISDLFNVSLDELVKGEVVPQNEVKDSTLDSFKEAVLTEENKARGKKTLKLVLILIGIVFAMDFITFLIYYLVNGGFPG